jgi:flavocytochrome c
MPDKENEVMDVTIIGSGGAAFAAAVEACGAGARVALLEKQEDLGGASIISGGGCWIAGSPLQESIGIKDSPDDGFEDWVKWGGGAADEPWARYYIDHSLHDLYFWAEGLGLKWIDFKFQEGNRVLRWHRADNNGLGLVTVLMDTARNRGLTEIHTSTEVTEIIMDRGRACGVKAIHLQSGRPMEIRSRTVIVATGGFCSNLDMIHEVRPELRQHKIMEGSAVGATGGGHRFLQKAGGYLTHMDAIWFYVYATPDYRDPKGRRGLVFRWAPSYIWVNQQGRRFHNEFFSGGKTAPPAFFSLNPSHAWAILEGGMLAEMEVADPYYRQGSQVHRDRVRELYEKSPYIHKAGAFPELARKIGVDVPTFLSTVERYNRACESGLENDPEFGKPLKGCKKFDSPPYYAFQLFPLARKSLGGVKADMKCRVLNKYFDPIPGLYAAGEVAGMAGGHINGLAALEGTMLGPSVFSGRVAGAWAAAETGHGKGFVGKPNRPQVFP